LHESRAVIGSGGAATHDPVPAAARRNHRFFTKFGQPRWMQSIKHDVIKAIVQRSLLNWWERRRRGADCPPVAALLDEDLGFALPEALIYAVEITDGDVDYRVNFHGRDLHPLYGGDVTGTTLTDHIILEHRAPILAAYDAVCRERRPVYTIRSSRDETGVPVRIETLRLPFVRPDAAVSQILTHVGVISIEGAFNRARVQREARAGVYDVYGVVAA
jgi:hypothetical protein